MVGLNNNGNGKPRLDDWPRLIRAGVNTEIKGKIDFFTDAKGRWSLTHNYTVAELTLEEFAAEIGKGHNICHPCINGSKFHRKKEFCQSADYVGIDVDNDQEADQLDAQGNKILDAKGKPQKIKVRCDDADYFSFEDAKRDPFILKHAGIIYLTPSSTPEWNRFRVIFVLPRRLHVGMFKDEGKLTAQKQFEQAFDRIARYLIFKYRSDEACKDCSRFYYGTNQPDSVVIFGGYLPSDVMLQLRKEYEDAHPKVKPQEFKAALDIDVTSADAQGRAGLFGERALHQAKQHIEQAPMGHKNKTRARWAYLIGGYVAGGLLDEDYAFTELENSVRANTDNYNKSWKTLDECFAEGKNHPITLETCEQWRLKFAPADDRDEEIIMPDGEIIDPNDDPPISDDPALEKYLRKLLAHASRFTRARMMMAVALGFTKLPWRLLDAILAYEYGSLNVRSIANEKMLNLYAKNGERAASESTLTRDKRKLWKQQDEKGIELVWYKAGFEALAPGQKPGEGKRIASRYKSNLDRWTLEAIALAIKKKGKYSLKDAEIQGACEEIAKQVPRCQIEDAPLPPDPDADTIQVGAEKSLDKLATKFHEAWDLKNFTVGERHIETRFLLRRFGTSLLKGADTIKSHGKQRRKKSNLEIKQTLDSFVGEVLRDVSPVNGHARVTNSPPFSRTDTKKAGENDTPDAVLHGSHFDYHARNEESTTYRWSVENEETTNELRRIETRKEEIRSRFVEIQPADGRVFVAPDDSDEVIRLAEELDEMDRQSVAVRAGEFYPPIVPSGPDPLVDASLEDHQYMDF
jgi:hypothetical protein